MASDTATLDLERVQQERRRLEGRGDAPDRVPLGPDDRAPDGEGPVETDPATRAHEIVQEVLAAAQDDGPTAAADPATAEPDSVAASTARRIVEDVLTAAAEAAEMAAAETAETEPAPTAAAEPTPDERAGGGDEAPGGADLVRADLVLLSVPDPIVLLPGETFDPGAGPYLPDPQVDVEVRVEQALRPLTAPASTRDMVVDQLRSAGESPVPGVRWAVVAAVWALAFALVVPFALRGIVGSVDLTVDLFSPEDIEIAEQETSEAAEELLEDAEAAEEAEAEGAAGQG